MYHKSKWLLWFTHVICCVANCIFKLPLLLNVDEQLKIWRKLLMLFPLSVRNTTKARCALSEFSPMHFYFCAKRESEEKRVLKNNYRHKICVNIFFHRLQWKTEIIIWSLWPEVVWNIEWKIALLSLIEFCMQNYRRSFWLSLISPGKLYCSIFQFISCGETFKLQNFVVGGTSQPTIDYLTSDLPLSEIQSSIKSSFRVSFFRVWMRSIKLHFKGVH